MCRGGSQHKGLGDSFDIWPRGTAGAGQESHAFASHLSRHLAQFFRPLVVDRCELLESRRRSKFRDPLKCKLSCIPASMQNTFGGDFENVIPLNDKGYKIL